MQVGVGLFAVLHEPLDQIIDGAGGEGEPLGAQVAVDQQLVTNGVHGGVTGTGNVAEYRVARRGGLEADRVESSLLRLSGDGPRGHRTPVRNCATRAEVSPVAREISAFGTGASPTDWSPSNSSSMAVSRISRRSHLRAL